MEKLQRLGYPAFFVVMAVLPHLLNPRWQAVAITFLIFAVVALSQDIVLGKCGMFNMGQALFFGLGAYATAILNHQFGWPILATIPVAILVPVLFGILLAGPIVHLRGDYLLVTTIGFNIVFVQVLQNNLGGITGGPNGIFGLDAMNLFGLKLTSQVSVYYFAFAVLLFTFWLMHNLENSKAGRALHYLREDQLAAESIGINARVYKVFAFGLSAGIAGLAGTVYATQYAAVSPEAFDFIQSVLFFSIVIVGGSSVPGVLIGVFVMFVLPEIFREFATWRFFIFGFAMILAMILRPRGIWPAKFGRIPAFLVKEGGHGN
ncbi:MAG: branched-chain amino acid ABC transporter permease [Deltaproteobacteria bacterium]|nr:MAG: branched-chain amino acid ABC transporter permease [Deltaproteobacteria bacterium]